MGGAVPLRPGDSGLSRSLVRHLFHDRQIAAGSRVLDVGCGDGRLVEWLESTGIDAVGVDWRPDVVLTARAASPRCTFRLTRPSEDLPFAEGQFDLVLARDLDAFQADLFSPTALLTTANLLANVRPGGHLVLLLEDAGQAPLHRRSCFARHLGCFPGAASIRFVPRPFRWRDLGRLFGGSRQGEGHLTASLRTPQFPLSLNDWRRFALKALATTSHASACCDRGTQPEIQRTAKAA